MVRASIAGAILANLLLAMGVAFLLGGLHQHTQEYNAGAARFYSTMMLLAVFSLAVPSAFSRFFSATEFFEKEQALNLAVAILLLAVYVLYLVFMLRTHPELFKSAEAGGHDEGGHWGMPRVVGSLVLASVLAAWMSEVLVGAAEATGEAMGMSSAFIGIVFLAIVGGAAESGSAIAMARKNRMDLSVGIALGSCIQIALFVAPALVLASYFVAPHPLELAFSRPEVGSLLIGVIIGTLVLGDGKANWFKGVQLIIVYGIIATLFYFLPELSAATAP